MSITFSCQDVAYEEYYPFADSPDPEARAFKDTRPVAPFFDLNMANGNAMDLMEAVGIPQNYCGSMTPAAAKQLLPDVILLLGNNAGVMQLVEPTVREGNMIYCGRDSEYVTRRLTQLATLLALAVKYDKTIVWG